MQLRCALGKIARRVDWFERRDHAMSSSCCMKQNMVWNVLVRGIKIMAPFAHVRIGHEDDLESSGPGHDQGRGNVVVILTLLLLC